MARDDPVDRRDVGVRHERLTSRPALLPKPPVGAVRSPVAESARSQTLEHVRGLAISAAVGVGIVYLVTVGETGGFRPGDGRLRRAHRDLRLRLLRGPRRSAPRTARLDADSGLARSRRGLLRGRRRRVASRQPLGLGARPRALPHRLRGSARRTSRSRARSAFSWAFSSTLSTCCRRVSRSPSSASRKPSSRRRRSSSRARSSSASFRRRSSRARAIAISARNLPARFVAGDFYDVFHLPDGAVGLVVADVAGKGMGASLIMATVKAALPFLAADRSVDEALREANRRLKPRLDPREFVALTYARYDPETGRLRARQRGPAGPVRARTADGDRRARSRPRARASRSACGPRSRTRRSSGRSLRESGCCCFPTAFPRRRRRQGEPLGYERFEDVARRRPHSSTNCSSRCGAATGPTLADDWTVLVLERTT